VFSLPRWGAANIMFFDHGSKKNLIWYSGYNNATMFSSLSFEVYKF